MAKQKINPYQTAGTIIGIEGTDHNPLPTSVADSPGSSVTFTLPVAATLYITFGCNMQMNTSLSSYLYLNIDGSNNKSCKNTSNSAGQEYREASRTVKVPLAAGSHTIKLQGMASAGTAAVNIAPYWWATITT